jgi:hypothetical protein
MSYLYYLCLFAYSGVQHILCGVFVLFFFVVFSVSVSTCTLILILLFVDIKEEMYKLPTKGSIIIKCICLIKESTNNNISIKVQVLTDTEKTTVSKYWLILKKRQYQSTDCFFSISQYFDTVIFSVSVSTLILSFFQYQSVLWYCHFFSISMKVSTYITSNHIFQPCLC